MLNTVYTQGKSVFSSLEVRWEDTEIEKKGIAQYDGEWYNSLISKNWSKERWSLGISLFNTFIVLGTEGHTSFPAGVSSTIKDIQLKRIFFCCLNPNYEAENWD